MLHLPTEPCQPSILYCIIRPAALATSVLKEADAWAKVAGLRRKHGICAGIVQLMCPSGRTR